MPDFNTIKAAHLTSAQKQQFVPLTPAQLIALAIKIAKAC